MGGEARQRPLDNVGDGARPPLSAMAWIWTAGAPAPTVGGTSFFPEILEPGPQPTRRRRPAARPSSTPAVGRAAGAVGPPTPVERSGRTSSSRRQARRSSPAAARRARQALAGAGPNTDAGRARAQHPVRHAHALPAQRPDVISAASADRSGAAGPDEHAGTNEDAGAGHRASAARRGRARQNQRGAGAARGSRCRPRRARQNRWRRRSRPLRLRCPATTARAEDASTGTGAVYTRHSLRPAPAFRALRRAPDARRDPYALPGSRRGGRRAGRRRAARNVNA